ncbi:hypothetical protein ATANTOWER_011534, partial [Ataeniobius toweri]|nr:hypothetical protein [Ataeniobius toweri]
TLEPSSLTAAQIRYVLFHNAVPFIGFGFLDNAIMIAAGTQIELSIGVTLGISTMAADEQVPRKPVPGQKSQGSRKGPCKGSHNGPSGMEAAKLEPMEEGH